MSIPAGPTFDAFSSTIDASNPFTSSDMPPPLFPCCVPALPLAFPAAASLPHSSLAESWNPPLVSELERGVEKRRSLLSCNVRRKHASLQATNAAAKPLGSMMLRLLILPEYKLEI